MSTAMKSLLGSPAWHGAVYGRGWQPARVTGVSRAPATAESLAVVGLGDASDVDAAAASAAIAQSAWIAAAADKRAEVLAAAARLLESHEREIASWLIRETGATRAKAAAEIRVSIRIVKAAEAMLAEPQGIVLPSRVDEMSMATRLPRGVVGVISPFNAPLALSLRAIAPALATGNAVIHKPDPRTAVCGGVLVARLFEEAGLPPGLLHVLPGGADVGMALCRHPTVAMIAFTGSSAVGRQVNQIAAAHLKKVSLELGGKNALIVLDDADVEAAGSSAAWGAWYHQGQLCMTTGLILVHERIADAFIETLAATADALQVGDPAAGDVALGPLIDEQHVQHVHDIVMDTIAAGARLVTGGSYDRLFYRPTVLSGVKPGMRAFEEEIFGPVAVVSTFSNDAEAADLASRSEYGLAAAILSPCVPRALALGRRLKTGLLHINDQTIADEPWVPFGGRGASGNGTRIGGAANWDLFTEWQWTTIRSDVRPRSLRVPSSPAGIGALEPALGVAGPSTLPTATCSCGACCG